MEQKQIIYWSIAILIFICISQLIINIQYKNTSNTLDEMKQKVEHFNTINNKLVLELNNLQQLYKIDSTKLHQINNNYETTIKNYYNNDTISNDSISSFISKNIERKRTELLLLYSRRK